MPIGSLSSGWKIARIYGITIRLHLSWLIIFGLLIFMLAKEVLPVYNLTNGEPWWTLAEWESRVRDLQSEYPRLTVYGAREVLGIAPWPEWQYWVLAFIGSVGLFICVLAHELAHSIVAKSCGIPVEGITLFVFGGVARLKDEARTPGVEFKVAAVGPLMSILIGVACGVMYVGLGSTIPAQARALLFYFSLINLGLAVFNLLPGFPLDGGRLLRAILWSALGDLRKATAIASWCGQAFAGFLMFFGGLQIFLAMAVPGYAANAQGVFWQAIWLVVIGLFLWNAAKAGYRQMAFRQAFEGLCARDVIQRQVVAVPPDVSLEDLVDRYFYVHRFHSFPVVEADPPGPPQADVPGSPQDDLPGSPQADLPESPQADLPGSPQADRLVGLISLRDVQTIPRTDWPVRRVREVMHPVSEADMVRPDEELVSVFRKMIEADRGHLPVVEDGRLVGIVTRRDVLSLLQIRTDLGGRAPHRAP